ncbi:MULTISPECIES: ferredoxin [unclassified Streptomyces]|uniref:ferredoxin n=1 Tax=unclassified Streptomyces TaxID=2593676 RepID=UPI0036C343E9
MRITVDTGRCVGAGQCVLTAPDLFDQDDDGLVTVLAPPADGPPLAGAQEAASLCPSGAITVTES